MQKFPEHVETRSHEVEPLCVPTTVLIRDVYSVAVIGVWIMKPLVRISEVIFAQVVRRIDVCYVDRSCISALKRCHRLEAVTFNDQIAVDLADGKFRHGLKDARRGDSLTVDA